MVKAKANPNAFGGEVLEWNRYPRNYGSSQEKAGGRVADTASDNKSPGK
jgi:hypothetical protein